jgi:hypothetical protein
MYDLHKDARMAFAVAVVAMDMLDAGLIDLSAYRR